MRSIIKALVFAGVANLVDAASTWDYKTNGADWPKLTVPDNECGKNNQSPIDLKNDWTVVHPKTDDF
jgi:hypothetical protein